VRCDGTFVVRFVLFDSILRWDCQFGRRHDLHEVNSRVVHRKRRVPQPRSDRDESLGSSLQVEELAVDSNALGSLPVAVLKAPRS
jgi:hypothetical protein